MSEHMPRIGAPQSDPRNDAVRIYEDMFCAFANAFVDRVKELRTIEGSDDLQQRARTLLREHEDWVAAYPAPHGLIPPARPGDFLDSSGLQPTSRMYHCAFAQARMLARLLALVNGGSSSVLSGTETEPRTAEEYLGELWKLYAKRREGGNR